MGTKWLLAALLTLSSAGLAQTTSFYTDRAVGTFPVGFGTAKTTALIPIQFGQVRVCTAADIGGVTSPCPDIATITDILGNPLSVVGGNFGQVKTDVVGRFSFGCTLGLNYLVQVAPGSSNVPQLSYPITCPGVGQNPVLVSAIINNAGVFTDTQMNQYLISNVNSLNFQTVFTNVFESGSATQAVAGGIAVPSTSTVTGAQGVAGYVTSASTTTGAVGVQGVVQSTAAGTHTFGGHFAARSQPGSAVATMVAAEIALYPQNVADGSTVLAGTEIGGDFDAQPTLAYAAFVRQPGGLGVGFWPIGLGFETGATPAPSATNAAIVFNPLTSAVNKASQGMTFVSNDPVSGTHNAQLNLSPAGNYLTNAPIQFAGVTHPSGIANVGLLWFDSTANQFQVNANNSFQNPIDTTVANTAQKSETGADANVLTFASIPAVAATYHIHFVISVSAANAATIGWTATWKDSNANSQTPVNLALFQVGTAAPALTFTTSAAGDYYGDITIDTDASATAPVIKFTFSGTSVAAKVTTAIVRLI